MTTARAHLFEFSLPLVEPLTTARGEIATRDGLLVRLDVDGVTGWGEATPLPGWTEPLPDCRAALADALGRFVRAGESEAFRVLADAPAARHAFALALLDVRASYDGLPLARYLGGEDADASVPVNATIGDGDADETRREAADSAAAGFDSLKIKVGARPVAGDVTRLRAVRDAIGPDVELRADANAAWTREQATEAVAAFADLGVSYVEQPLPATDLDGHAALRGGPVGIALDETLASVPLSDVLASGAADLVVLKPMALGGVADAYDVAEQARAAGVDSLVTTTVDGVVARTAAVHLAAALPARRACGLATAGLLASDLGSDPAPVENGRISVPDSAGLGVSPAPESEHVSTLDTYADANA